MSFIRSGFGQWGGNCLTSPLVHYHERTLITRTRSLAGLGRVMVRKGQFVRATDGIAQDLIRPDHLLLDISRGLGLPAEQADRALQCKIGALLLRGDLIAGPVGLTRRVVRAPQSGRVVMAGGGRVLLELTSEPASVLAGLPGEVCELLPDRGAVVRTTGALVQAVWGNGKIAQGVLQELCSEPSEDLSLQNLLKAQPGVVGLASHCQEPNVFTHSKSRQVGGLVLASLDPDLIPAAQAAPYAVLVVEGFGKHPYNPLVSRILTAAAGREIALNAEAWDRLRGLRPEAVIPLPGNGDESEPPEADLFTPGQQVRVVRAPYFGWLGILEDLCGPSRMPNGIVTEAAEVRFADGKLVTLPLANLEIIE